MGNQSTGTIVIKGHYQKHTVHMKQQPEIYLPHEELDDIAVYTLPDLQSILPAWVMRYMQPTQNLATELLKRSRHTVCCRVICDLFKDENINSGDFLIIDKQLKPKHGDLIACICDGEFMVKKLCLQPNLTLLIPSNPEHSLIRITEKNDFIILGVITYTILKQCKTH